MERKLYRRDRKINDSFDYPMKGASIPRRIGARSCNWLRRCTAIKLFSSLLFSDLFACWCKLIDAAGFHSDKVSPRLPLDHFELMKLLRWNRSDCAYSKQKPSWVAHHSRPLAEGSGRDKRKSEIKKKSLWRCGFGTPVACLASIGAQAVISLSF